LFAWVLNDYALLTRSRYCQLCSRHSKPKPVDDQIISQRGVMWHIMILRSLHSRMKGHSFVWVRKSDVHAACLLSTNSTSFARWQLVVTTASMIIGDGQSAMKSFNPNRGERVVVKTTARKRAHVLGRGMSIITAEAPAVRRRRCNVSTTYMRGR